MQVNNIAISANKCRKPCNTFNFRGDDKSCCTEKKRYKHYEQISDDVLAARSIIKAHQEVQNGGKMRLYKAIPAIATGVIATSLAITQPGKLSAKAATGLGFLATMAGIDAILDIASSKKGEDTRKKAYATLGALGVTAVGAAAVTKGKTNGSLDKVTKFISKEASQLASEINATKLADISNKYIEPFLQKHPRFEFAAPLIATISASVIAPLASAGLLKGISEDISAKACRNFQVGKMIQDNARRHFDSIDAIEV